MNNKESNQQKQACTLKTSIIRCFVFLKNCDINTKFLSHNQSRCYYDDSLKTIEHSTLIFGPISLNPVSVLCPVHLQ